MADHRLPEPDRPWVMRIYAGHSDARRSNETQPLPGAVHANGLGELDSHERTPPGGTPHA